MKYVWCPACGHKLMRCEEGSSIELKCAKCNRLVNVEIVGDELTLTVIAEPSIDRKNAEKRIHCGNCRLE